MCTKRFFLVFLVFLSAVMVLVASGNALAKYDLQQEIQLTNSGLSGDSDNQKPAVAYNWRRNEYLVAYHSGLNPGNTDIITSRVSPGGSSIDLGKISLGNECVDPDVAYDHQNDRYLIVWSRYNSTDSIWEIHGRIIPWNGPGASAPFTIASVVGLDLEIPAVAFGNNDYMVVWQYSNGGIGYRRVSADGVAQGSLANVDTGPNLGSPDITYNVTEAQYLIVYEGDGGVNREMDIFGRILNRDGSIPGNRLTIHTNSDDQKHPAVATNARDRYLVVWQHDLWGDGTDWDIRGQFLDESGKTIGIFQRIAETGDNETSPALGADGGVGKGEYLVVWQRETNLGKGIWGRLIYTDQALSSSSFFEIVPPGGGNNEDPAVGGGYNGGYFATYSWVDSTKIFGDIYGRMLLDFPWPVFVPAITGAGKSQSQ